MLPLKSAKENFILLLLLTIALEFPRSTVVFLVRESLVLIFLVNGFFYVNSKALSRTDAIGMF